MCGMMRGIDKGEEILYWLVLAFKYGRRVADIAADNLGERLDMYASKAF